MKAKKDPGEDLKDFAVGIWFVLKVLLVICIIGVFALGLIFGLAIALTVLPYVIVLVITYFVIKKIGGHLRKKAKDSKK